MHGSTREMVEYLTGALMQKNIPVLPCNMIRADIGELAKELVDAATVVIASPTVLSGPHPAILYVTYLVNALRPKIKFASIIGSFGWGGRMLEILQSQLGNIKAEILEPVMVKGYPRPTDYQALQRLADDIEREAPGIGRFVLIPSAPCNCRRLRLKL